MLIKETRLLEYVIAECVNGNLPSLEIVSLLPDMAKVSATLSEELERSARAYMEQYHWHACRAEKRSS